MEKILIVIPHMAHGGIQVALINTLKTVDFKKYDIYIGIETLTGELLSKMPSNVHMFELMKYPIEKVDNIKKVGCVVGVHDLVNFGGLVLSSLYNRIIHDATYYAEFYSKLIINIPIDQFDYVISYGQPVAFSVFYVQYIKAKKRIMWVHGDVSEIGLNMKIKRLYKKFDNIICVSEYAKRSFCKLFPELSDRTTVKYTPIDVEDMKKRAYDYSVTKPYGKNIFLTIARLSDEKGVALALEAAKQLKDERIQFVWYICGDGPNKCKFEEYVKANQLNEEVILLGFQDNPYPYFTVADIYIQPSLNEGYCLSMAEAKFFKIPLVATCFPAAYEHIQTEKQGIICEMNGGAIAEAILQLLNKRLFYE